MKIPFTKNLLAWNRTLNTRQMPWKGEKDPYKIWISEIILQQTRVEQGLKYYERFIAAFPNVSSLANAPEQEVFKLWEGLGYYSRCKNLLASAKFICDSLQGNFPSDYDAIRNLKGVGDYTAAAISSFAFDLPHAVVDGNVLRVLSRYFGSEMPVDTTKGKKFYTELADTLLDRREPGLYNQGIMDFGAVICKPQQPACGICVQQQECRAFQEKKTHLLPLKKKAPGRRSRWFYYFIIECGEQVYIRKRGARDIWENLYEFVLVETDAPFFLESDHSVQHLLYPVLGGHAFEIAGVSDEYRQQLTHQTVTGKFVQVRIPAPAPQLTGYELVKKANLTLYPFPRLITLYL